MFWWLWSTRKKVTVLLLVLALPVSFLLLRVGAGIFSGPSGERAEPAPVSTAAPATTIPEASESTVPPEDVEKETPAGPLVLRARADIRPPAQIAAFEWLATGVLPLPKDVGLILPGGENGLSFWGLHRNTTSYKTLVDSYVDRYAKIAKVERVAVSGTLERLRFSGKLDDYSFEANVRFLDLGNGEVSVAGVVTGSDPGN